MKINNINKRLIAGMLGGVMLTTPLTLAACGSYEYVTKEDGNVFLNPDKLYHYNMISKLMIADIKTKINENIYLVEDVEGLFSHECINVFTRKTVYSIDLDGVELVSEEDINQYLIAYNMLKESYSVEDLKYLLEKIKQDVYSNNNKEFVKAK